MIGAFEVKVQEGQGFGLHRVATRHKDKDGYTEKRPQRAAY